MKIHASLLLYLAAAALLPRVALAHSPGLSQSDFVVDASGAVHAEIVLSSKEAIAQAAVDRDHDGALTDDEVAAARADLSHLVVDEVEVDADGSACPARFDGAALTQGDALALDATYACPAGAGEIGVTLFFLTELGPTHRHVARISTSSGDHGAQRILTGSDRYLALTLGPKKAASRAPVIAAVAGAAAALAIAAWLLVRRRGRMGS